MNLPSSSPSSSALPSSSSSSSPSSSLTPSSDSTAAPAPSTAQPAPRKHRRLAWLTGVVSVTLLVLNTLLSVLPIVPLALVKLAFPTPAVRRRVDPWLNAIATGWISRNTGWITRLQPDIWDIEINTELKPDDWYLVSCNHQSWVDIFVLQRVLNKRIPLLKFFLKQTLLYVPVIGLAWWALDFPFLKRYSKAKLRRNPALAHRDREIAQRACEKFQLVPTSVMVFAEGTRFTEAKRVAQASPYRHLLKPRAGALAATLNAMGAQFRSMVDATIIYPDGAPRFWDLACGRSGRIVVRIQQTPIPADFCAGNYATDPTFRRALHQWLKAMWEAKDRQIDAAMQ